MQTRFLHEIAAIVTGVTDETETMGGEKYFCFQPNSFNEFGEVMPLQTIRRKEPVEGKQLVRVGDVLIKRLNPNYPFLVHYDMPGTVVSTNLFIVRPAPEIYPAYLAFLLEHTGVLAQIEHLSGSTSTIKAVSAKKLMDITLQLVPAKNQKPLGDLWWLAKRWKKLLRDYITASDHLLSIIADQHMK